MDISNSFPFRSQRTSPGNLGGDCDRRQGAEVTRVTRGYAICTQPRSGSNLLCQYLASTGCMGLPMEYFNGPARRTLGLPEYPDEPSLQIRYILENGSTKNGVYGVKLFASQLERVSKLIRWSDDLPNLRYVYLYRKDLLGQALSWARALQTSQYRSTQPILAEPAYEGLSILHQLHTLASERARWELFFARTGVRPVTVLYEDILIDPLQCVERIAEELGVTSGKRVDTSKIDLERQRDDATEEWRKRFLSEFGDPNRFDTL